MSNVKSKRTARVDPYTHPSSVSTPTWYQAPSSFALVSLRSIFLDVADAGVRVDRPTTFGDTSIEPRGVQSGRTPAVEVVGMISRWCNSTVRARTMGRMRAASRERIMGGMVC